MISKPTTGEVQREGQIQKQLESLDKATQILNDTIDRVEDRLMSVLVPPEPMAKEEKETLRESLVPLADSLRKQVEFVESHSRRLADILSRIEL